MAKVKPFTILIPPWDEINEELVEELDQLLGGKVSSGSLIAELTVLKEECLGQKVLKKCLSV